MFKADCCSLLRCSARFGSVVKSSRCQNETACQHMTSWPNCKRKEQKKILVPREKTRALLDIGFSALFIGIAIPYFWIGSPSPVVELFLLYGILSMTAGLFKRMALFRSLRLFYDQHDHALYLISSVEVKRYPLDQCVDIQMHTAPDILQLFHLFHLFSPHADYTVNIGKT